MNALDILKYGDNEVQKALQPLPVEHWETNGVCGWWSVKDILSHLASFEHVLDEVLSGFLEPGDTPYLESMATSGPGGFNDIEVDKRRDWTPAQVKADYDDTYRRVKELAARIPPETWRQVGTLPWYGDEYSLDDYVVYGFYGHKREHMAQVNVFKDSLKADGA
jgi:hypothetical protein